MTTVNAAVLVNILGFSVGIALYSLLGLMVLRHRRFGESDKNNLLLLAAAACGLVWNLGELLDHVSGGSGQSSLFIAASFSALGFLPSLMAHGSRESGSSASKYVIASYGMSVLAAGLHLFGALSGGAVPSDAALILLTIGSVGLALIILIFGFRQAGRSAEIWSAVLVLFAVSTYHLRGSSESHYWFVELLAHQSSLPLVLAILYQNYRFAFADLFLKRAISLMLITTLAALLFIFGLTPIRESGLLAGSGNVGDVSLVILLCVISALVYPLLHDAASWFVDRIMLRRSDYDELREHIDTEISTLSSEGEILDRVCSTLGRSLTASSVVWAKTNGVKTDQAAVSDSLIFIPTTEEPRYQINIGDFQGGRRLLSEETSMLNFTALSVARQIDAVRMTHERCEQEIREQEFSKLAAEAQLTALRSQINPHFLFNALTTIGYLIKTSPDQAFQTLMGLTKLLRRVLSSTGEFCRLGDEIDLIENYVEIERSRFEERLEVNFNIADDLYDLKIPALVLQPLVENAIKHAISENANGGVVSISAEVKGSANTAVLKIKVSDTGGGNVKRNESSTGVGLKNIRERLASHYGRHAFLDIDISHDHGTTAELTIPVTMPRSIALAS